MISVVQGKVGDGKSYHLTTMIVNHLLHGGVVATNMDISLDAIRKHFHRRIFKRQLIRISAESSPFDIPRGDFRGHGSRRVMVVLDEALNWFASASGAKDDRKATWGEWLRQSDKLGQDVYFIAQNFERSAKWIRELAQLLYSVMNLRNLTCFKLPLGRWLRLGRVYALAVYDIRSSMLVRWGLHVIVPLYYECYNTSELYGFPASSNAYDGLTVWPPFRLPLWPIFVPCLTTLFLVLWLWLV